jgi:hypothetical protein|nr:hypothetical protein Q903MT_gene4491 [Picea sitchensis]
MAQLFEAIERKSTDSPKGYSREKWLYVIKTNYGCEGTKTKVEQGSISESGKPSQWLFWRVLAPLPVYP